MKQYVIGLVTGLIVALAAVGYTKGSGTPSPRVPSPGEFIVIPIRVSVPADAAAISRSIESARILPTAQGYSQFVGLDTTHLKEGVLFLTCSIPKA